MKILYFSTSSGDTHNIISSLGATGVEHEVRVFRYDEKWHQQAHQACAAQPALRDQLQAGGWRILGWPRERVAMDDDMIRHTENFSPDIALMSSAWEGLFCPLNSTLAKLNSMVPLVHILHDGADHPWWPQLKQFEADKCFSATVNIDGSHVWPGGRDWTDDTSRITNGLSLLTPVDPRPYGDQFIPHTQRMYPLCYAGNAGGPIRSYVVQLVGRAIPQMVCRPREESTASYGGYSQLLKASRIVINVPFSGSNQAKHVKGRVVEAGFAGTCLMEWQNPSTRAWFTPRHSYVEYGSDDMWTSIEDCIETAQHLISRPKLAEEIAYEHWLKVRAEHSPAVFWSKVFAAVGRPKEAERAEAAD